MNFFLKYFLDEIFFKSFAAEDFFIIIFFCSRVIQERKNKKVPLASVATAANKSIMRP